MRSSFLVNEYSRLVNKLKNADWFGIYWSFVIVFLPLYHPRGTWIIVSNHVKTISSREYKDSFFYLACALSLALFQKDAVKKLAWQKLTALAFITLLFLNWSKVYDAVSFFYILGISLFFAVSFQFANHWQKSKRLICYGFFIALVAQLFWLCAQWVNFEPSHLWGTFRQIKGCTSLPCPPLPIVGSLDNSMVTAAYIVPIVGFATFVAGWYAVMIGLIQLLVLKSAMAWFAFVSCAIFLVIWGLNERKAWLGFLVPIATVFTVPFIAHYLPFLDDSTRYGAWSSTIKKVGFTVTGKGAGWFWHNGRQVVDPKLMFFQEHNEYLSLYVMAGAVGIILAIAFFRPILKCFRYDFNAAAALLATFCVAWGAFPLHISSSALTFAIACGALMSYINIENQAKH